MNLRLVFKLGAFLVPAVAALVFLAWWLDPEKKVIRRADAVFATVERSPMALEGPDEKVLRFNELVAPSFAIRGPDPLPTATLTRAEASGLLAEFHESILSCGVVRGETTVRFPGPDTARLECEVTVTVSQGRGLRRVQNYRCQMEFRRTAREWLLAELAATPF